jgi:peroxiredoxin
MSAHALFAVYAAAIGAAAIEPALPDLSLPGTDGQTHALRQAPAAAKVTVIEFFSADCPVQRAHDARLKELAALRPQGVQVLLVDSEAGASLARDAAEVKARGYPFPILIDDRARLAQALGARFSTYSVLLDGEGRIRYRGGIDGERSHIGPKTRFVLRDGVERLLSGQSPDPSETKALGCFLRGW